MICQKTLESRPSVEGLRSADLADDERARSRLLNPTVLRLEIPIESVQYIYWSIHLLLAALGMHMKILQAGSEAVFALPIVWITVRVLVVLFMEMASSPESMGEYSNVNDSWTADRVVRGDRVLDGDDSGGRSRSVELESDSGSCDNRGNCSLRHMAGNTELRATEWSCSPDNCGGKIRIARTDLRTIGDRRDKT
jgi:hypothetical protein